MVESGQKYMSNVDRQRGRTRVLTVDRVLKSGACVCTSIIEADQSRPDRIGKRHRVYITTGGLMSGRYTHQPEVAAR